MAVVIRLARHGRTHSPFYRVVAADKRCPRDGRFLENLGTYNPSDKENGVNLKGERLQHWISKGAKPSETVARLMKRAGL